MNNLPELSENRSLLLSLAEEVILMQQQIDELTLTNSHLEKIKNDYFEVLNKSRQDTNEFVANVLLQIIGK